MPGRQYPAPPGESTALFLMSHPAHRIKDRRAWSVASSTVITERTEATRIRTELRPVTDDRGS